MGKQVVSLAEGKQLDAASGRKRKKVKKNGKGLMLFGPCWPNLGLNSDLNGAQKRLELGWD